MDWSRNVLMMPVKFLVGSAGRVATWLGAAVS
jgi:hypothetical protein